MRYEDQYGMVERDKVSKIAIKGHNDGCMQRIPYASLMATVTCFIGVVLFCIMMTWGFNATAEQTRRTLRIEDWPWLDKVQIFFVLLTVLMALFALFFLAIGFTATGSTREEMYKVKQAKCGGRFACALAMIFTVALLICWLLIISVLSVINSAYFTFSDVCGSMTSFSDSDCIDLGIFGPSVRHFSRANLRLCGGDAQQFCALTATAKTWYIIGWVGSLIVILGLVLFLAIHAANYAHVGNASRYIELKSIILETAPTPPAIPPPRFADESASQVREQRHRDRNNGSNGRFGYQSDMVSSTSRRAEQMSDSVSQYQYEKRPNYR